MGYSTRPELVTDNVEFLKTVKDSVESGREVELEVPSEENISSEQYKIRRLLAACDNHPEVLGGMFAGLGQRVSIKRDPSTRTLTLTQRSTSKTGKINLNVKTKVKDERSVLSQLASYEGEITTVTFSPSEDFTEEKLEENLALAGWELHSNSRMENDDATLTYGVERIVEAL